LYFSLVRFADIGLDSGRHHGRLLLRPSSPFCFKKGERAVPEAECEAPHSRQGKTAFLPASLGLAFFAGFVRYPTRFSFFASLLSRRERVRCPCAHPRAFLLGVASGAGTRGEMVRDRKPGADLPAISFGFCLLNGMLGLLILPALSLSAPLGNGVLGVIMLLTFLIARSWA